MLPSVFRFSLSLADVHLLEFSLLIFTIFSIAIHVSRFHANLKLSAQYLQLRPYRSQNETFTNHFIKMVDWFEVCVSCSEITFRVLITTPLAPPLCRLVGI